jgi:hypothetical protein
MEGNAGQEFLLAVRPADEMRFALGSVKPVRELWRAKRAMPDAAFRLSMNILTIHNIDL